MAFDSMAEVQAWADQNGGESAVRESFARGTWASVRSIELVREWLRVQAEIRATKDRDEAAEESRRATAAAERSAKWTMWAAVAAAASVMVQILVSLGWLDWIKHVN